MNLATISQRLDDPQRRWPLLVCFAVLALATFFGPLDIAEGTSNDLDARLARTPTLLLKLATALAAGSVGVWGIACLPRARHLLMTPPGWALCAIAAVFLLTCLTSVTAASVPIALVFVAYVLFVPTCLTVLGLRGTLLSVLCGVFLFTLGALFLYCFVPRYGVFPEDFGDGIIVNRLGGMSQPNHTGRAAMFGLLITAYFFRLPAAPRGICLSLMAIFLTAGLLAMSRTALLGAVVCLGLLNLDLLMTRAGLALACLGLLAAMASGLGLAAAGREEAIFNKVLGAVTKTGDVEEVTSMTGRAEIWERAVKLIKGRPLLGYGLGSNKIMLVDHLQSTHNILLHPTLAAGVAAGGLTLALLLWNLINVFTSSQLIIRALSAYLLISGLTEDTIYETFPGACTLLWLSCCLWPARFSFAVRQTQPAQGAPRVAGAATFLS
jgi:O-antigen ligase